MTRRARPTLRDHDRLTQELRYRQSEIESLTDTTKVLRIALRDVEGRYNHVAEQLTTLQTQIRTASWWERLTGFRGIRNDSR